MIKIEFRTQENGPERLVAEAEVHFTEGPLAGMKLVGFSLWKGYEGDLFVTFPARSFGAGGERRFFDLLRPTAPVSEAPKIFKAEIIQKYKEWRG